ncbi:MAG TPA: hypothetical protein VLA72_08265 [Anaerolineales bacterium]|nr:hypothetical protein [Anaerolineales bacterium]
MAIPNLSPRSTTNANVLTATGSVLDVAATLPFGVYAGSDAFLTGASDQVAYTYKKLGGDVLDIELAEGNVYAAYEEAVLEYSYIVNIHQSKNSLSDLLGAQTASFDQDGQIVSTDPLANSEVALKYPRFDYGFARRVSERSITEVGLGGTLPIYSASIDRIKDQQDYDLQALISGSSADSSSVGYFGQVEDKRVIIRRVFYKTPRAMWRFYGYYGGFSVVGNLRTYGQYADDSTFEIVPTWQNKLQAMAYEDALWTRISHYSYEIKNNQLRLFPRPDGTSPEKFWVEFTIDNQFAPWEEGDGQPRSGIDGINNMNTLPFQNIPYENINAIGKQWIRRFALALTKEILGQVRGKFSTVPIPGESVTLNASDLLSQAKSEQEMLRQELKETLDQLTYAEMAATDSTLQDSTGKVLQNIPAGIFVG